MRKTLYYFIAFVIILCAGLTIQSHAQVSGWPYPFSSLNPPTIVSLTLKPNSNGGAEILYPHGWEAGDHGNGDTNFDISNTNGSGPRVLLCPPASATGPCISDYAWQIPVIKNAAAGTSFTGPTSGAMACAEPEQGTSYKVVQCSFVGYVNNSATGQTFTFPTAFTNIPGISCHAATGVDIASVLNASGISGAVAGSLTATAITFSHSNTASYSGSCVITGG